MEYKPDIMNLEDEEEKWIEDWLQEIITHTYQTGDVGSLKKAIGKLADIYDLEVPSHEPKIHTLKKSSLMTLQQLIDKNIAIERWPFNILNLRSLHFRRKSNGLSEAFLKVGNRVLVDEDKFYGSGRPQTP